MSGSSEVENVENVKKLTGIVKFDGFDDVYDDLENEAVLSAGPLTDKKRKRGGKKKNRRQRMITEINEYLRAEHGAQQHVPKSSRLLLELHNRERVHGMTRDETRELLHDKLLFLGDVALKSIRLRRFCLVVTSDEQFDLGNGTKIPAEIISISMDNGKINSILRFFPTYTKTFEMDGVEVYGKHRMKRVHWNPSMVRDSNLMCRTWCHFLDRCLLNLILVPVSCQRALIDLLRTLNEIRSVLNDRPTVSICLSRVISCEDFVTAAQNVIAPITADPIPTRQPDQDLLNYGLELCRYHLQSMSKIFMSATFTGNGGGVKPPTSSAPPIAPSFYKNNNNNNNSFNASALYSRLAAGNSNDARFGQNRSYSFLELIDEAPVGYPEDSEKYQRIMRWIADIAMVTSSENATSSIEGGGKMLEEDEEHGDFLKVLSTGITTTRSDDDGKGAELH